MLSRATIGAVHPAQHTRVQDTGAGVGSLTSNPSRQTNPLQPVNRTVTFALPSNSGIARNPLPAPPQQDKSMVSKGRVYKVTPPSIPGSDKHPLSLHINGKFFNADSLLSVLQTPVTQRMRDTDPTCSPGLKRAIKTAACLTTATALTGASGLVTVMAWKAALSVPATWTGGVVAACGFGRVIGTVVGGRISNAAAAGFGKGALMGGVIETAVPALSIATSTAVLRGFKYDYITETQDSPKRYSDALSQPKTTRGPLCGDTGPRTWDERSQTFTGFKDTPLAFEATPSNSTRFDKVLKHRFTELGTDILAAIGLDISTQYLDMKVIVNQNLDTKANKHATPESIIKLNTQTRSMEIHVSPSFMRRLETENLHPRNMLPFAPCGFPTTNTQRATHAGTYAPGAGINTLPPQLQSALNALSPSGDASGFRGAVVLINTDISTPPKTPDAISTWTPVLRRGESPSAPAKADRLKTYVSFIPSSSEMATPTGEGRPHWVAPHMFESTAFTTTQRTPFGIRNIGHYPMPKDKRGTLPTRKDPTVFTPVKPHLTNTEKALSITLPAILEGLNLTASPGSVIKGTIDTPDTLMNTSKADIHFDAGELSINMDAAINQRMFETLDGKPAPSVSTQIRTPQTITRSDDQPVEWKQDEYHPGRFKSNTGITVDFSELYEILRSEPTSGAAK